MKNQKKIVWQRILITNHTWEKSKRCTFLTRASVDVLVTKYECITLYGWIPLATLKLFKCMQPWSLISGWQERRQCDRTSTSSSSSSSFSFLIPDVRCRRRISSVPSSGADATCTTIIFWQRRRQRRGGRSSLLALAGACVSLTWKESGPWEIKERKQGELPSSGSVWKRDRSISWTAVNRGEREREMGERKKETKRKRQTEWEKNTASNGEEIKRIGREILVWRDAARPSTRRATHYTSCFQSPCFPYTCRVPDSASTCFGPVTDTSRSLPTPRVAGGRRRHCDCSNFTSDCTPDANFTKVTLLYTYTSSYISRAAIGATNLRFYRGLLQYPIMTCAFWES